MTSTRTKTNTFSKHQLDTSILYALSTDNYEEFCSLVNEGNVNYVIDSKNGFTSLHYAVMMNREKYITYLLNMGANPRLKNHLKEDAFDMSLKYQNKAVFSYEIDDKTKINSELQRIINDLQRSNSNLDVNNKYLSKSLDEVIMKNSLLKNTLSSVKKENSQLKDEKMALSESVKSLSTVFKRLENENGLLLAEFDMIHSENTVLRTDMQSLKRKHDKLEDSYSGLLNKMRK